MAGGSASLSNSLLCRLISPNAARFVDTTGHVGSNGEPGSVQVVFSAQSRDAIVYITVCGIYFKYFSNLQSNSTIWHNFFRGEGRRRDWKYKWKWKKVKCFRVEYFWNVRYDDIWNRHQPCTSHLSLYLFFRAPVVKNRAKAFVKENYNTIELN